MNHAIGQEHQWLRIVTRNIRGLEGYESKHAIGLEHQWLRITDLPFPGTWENGGFVTVNWKQRIR